MMRLMYLSCILRHLGNDNVFHCLHVFCAISRESTRRLVVTKIYQKLKEKKKQGSTSETILKMLVRGTSTCFQRRYEKCSGFLGNGERSGRGKSSGGNFAENYASDVSIPRQPANPNDLKIVAVARANATRYSGRRRSPA